MKTITRKQYLILTSNDQPNQRGAISWAGYGYPMLSYDDALMQVLAMPVGSYAATRIVGVELPTFNIEKDDEPLFAEIITGDKIDATCED